MASRVSPIFFVQPLYSLPLTLPEDPLPHKKRMKEDNHYDDAQTAQVSVRVFNIQKPDRITWLTPKFFYNNKFLPFFVLFLKGEKKTKEIRPIKSQKGGRTV